MKIGWGYRITILYLSFVALIVTLVIKSSQQKVDLVSADYYEQELRFQDQLNGMNNAAAVGGTVNWEARNDSVTLHLPEELYKAGVKGNVVFYRPSDSNLDLEMPLAVDNNGRQCIVSPKFKRGLYKMKIRAKAAGKDYYYEESVFMN